MSKRTERMKATAHVRVKRANGSAKSAYIDVWVKMGTSIRDELPKLRGAPLSVLIYLASRMDKKYQCNPSVGLIAKQTGYRIRWVQEALVYLRESGFIHYETQDWKYGEGRQPSNVYTITKSYEHEGKRYSLFEYGRHSRNGNKPDDLPSDEPFHYPVNDEPLKIV